MTIHQNRPAPPVPDPRAPLDDIDGALFDRLAQAVADDDGQPIEYGQRIISQTLVFLVVCGLNPAAGLGPSKQVDKGWHKFLEVAPAAYAEYCRRVAGRHIAHVPDPPGTSDVARAARVGTTLAAIRVAGLPLDHDLWLTPGSCSQCYAGCVDDPRTET